MILSAQSIRKLSIVRPCVPAEKYLGISFGLSHAGYDIRVAEQHLLSPKDFTLASSVEKFVMPDNVVGIVHDKSTWARRGLSVFNTVLEPGWIGYLTLELANVGSELLDITKGVGIAQVVFHLMDEVAERPYHGKYQYQKAGPQPAVFENG